MRYFVTNDESNLLLGQGARQAVSMEQGRVSERDQSPVLHRALAEVVQG